MLSLRLEQNLRQTQRLSHSQKLALKQMLTLSLSLRHNEFPNARRGLDGMLKAHQILKNNQSVGVLIGGLAEEVWKSKATYKSLNEHKDVDILISEGEYKPGEFDEGIDWWVGNSAKVTYATDSGVVEGRKINWFENCSGTALNYGVNSTEKLAPGLYIPSPEWITDLRELEALAIVEDNIIDEMDSSVIEKFRKDVEKGMGSKLPRFVVDKFAGYILDCNYERDYNRVKAIEIVRFDKETTRAIGQAKMGIGVEKE